MVEVKHITFDSKNYENEKEFWDTIATQLKILTKAGYDTRFRYEDCGIYVLEFDYQDSDIADYFCRWLTAEEYDMITDYRYDVTDRSSEKEEM